MALNKQWETLNPIKVNRIPKAPQVNDTIVFAQSSNNLYTGFLPP